MEMTEMFRAQLEREAAGTRKALERVPVDRNDWKPHPKSMPFGRLAALIAMMPAWIAGIVETNEMDISTGAGAPQNASTNRELVEVHEKSLEAGLKALSNTTDEHLMTPWRLLFGEKVLDERPRHLIIADTRCRDARHRRVFARAAGCAHARLHFLHRGIRRRRRGRGRGSRGHGVRRAWTARHQDRGVRTADPRRRVVVDGAHRDDADRRAGRRRRRTGRVPFRRLRGDANAPNAKEPRRLGVLSAMFGLPAENVRQAVRRRFAKRGTAVIDANLRTSCPATKRLPSARFTPAVASSRDIRSRHRPRFCICFPIGYRVCRPRTSSRRSVRSSALRSRGRRR